MIYKTCVRLACSPFLPLASTSTTFPLSPLHMNRLLIPPGVAIIVIVIIVIVVIIIVIIVIIVIIIIIIIVKEAEVVKFLYQHATQTPAGAPQNVIVSLLKITSFPSIVDGCELSSSSSSPSLLSSSS